MSLRYAFFINFESKMPSKKGPWEVSFLVCLISWFLKDVLNKILTFDSEMDPKIDAKRKNKSLKLEVEEKKAKMLQNGCQRDPEGYPNSQKIDTKTYLKRYSFFFTKKEADSVFEPKKLSFYTIHLWILKKKKRWFRSSVRHLPVVWSRREASFFWELIDVSYKSMVFGGLRSAADPLLMQLSGGGQLD